MITETIEFKNFNDEPDSATMHFHISEAVLMDNMDMRDRIAHLADILQGEKHQLSIPEIKEIVEIVKWFMAISYGVKSIDGTKFAQDRPVVGDGPIWHDFQSTPAYDAFLMSLFRNPEKAVTFVVNVLPAELRNNAMAQAEQNPLMKDMLKGADQAARPAPGTKIVDEYTQPTLTSVPDPEPAPTDEFDAMLAEAPEVTKTPINRNQYDFMKERLSADPGKFETFMSTRVLVED